MGEHRHLRETTLTAPGRDAVGAALGFIDDNTLTQSFKREIAARARNGKAPACLLLDFEEDGKTLWASSPWGRASRQLNREYCRCFDEQSCISPQPAEVRPPGCDMFLPFPEPSHRAEDKKPPSFDLVISSHSISFIAQPRAVCFLNRLRGYVTTGGLLFISAYGKYSSLAQQYEDAEADLAVRYFPLASGIPSGIDADTKVCLYSERDLCTTLFEAGWSVLRSSTSTDNNVLATAMRL